MRLLERLDKALGSGVMERRVFEVSGGGNDESLPPDSPALVEVSSGVYDQLFQGSSKPSELYKLARKGAVRVSGADVEVNIVSPLKALASKAPVYPPLARVAHVSGQVEVKFTVREDGTTANPEVESGPKLLWGSVTYAVNAWKFPKELANQELHATVKFNDCQEQRD